MGRSVAAKMKWISGLLILLPLLVNGATYEETRQVKDSAGRKFTCTYKLVYNNKGEFNKAKSSAVCKPNKTGKTVTETFVIENIGKSVTVKHAVKKGKKAITSILIQYRLYDTVFQNAVLLYGIWPGSMQQFPQLPQNASCPLHPGTGAPCSASHISCSSSCSQHS